MRESFEKIEVHIRRATRAYHNQDDDKQVDCETYEER